MISAARVARTFGMDPAVVLAGTPDRLGGVPYVVLTLVRSAAHNLIRVEEAPRPRPTEIPEAVA